jgi:hypothetical protein
MSYPTIEERSGHDVIACPCDGADGHELGCLAAGRCYGGNPTFECGNSFFEYILRVFAIASEPKPPGLATGAPNVRLLGFRCGNICFRMYEDRTDPLRAENIYVSGVDPTMRRLSTSPPHTALSLKTKEVLA